MEGIASLDALAAKQHGVFSRNQAAGCGLTYHQVRARLENGTWVALDANVFALRSASATWKRQLHAAVLSRPLAIVAGRSAGFLHEFPGFHRTRPEILVPFRGNARSPLARVIRSRQFERVATTAIEGHTATTIAETILTLSFRESEAVLERLIDDQLATGKLQIPDFDPIFERLADARLRGLPALRRVVGARDSKAYQPPTTELERLLYELLDDELLPMYTRQLPINFPQLDATVDAFIPRWNMIVEGDGRRWHTRKKDFEKDRQRDNAAAAAGYLVVRFSYSMLRDDPGGCLRTLVDAGGWRRTA